MGGFTLSKQNFGNILIKEGNMLISIVVPVFNLEDYIVRTLDSIFAQTYRDIEVIAVDDGSADNTPAILDEYAAGE